MLHAGWNAFVKKTDDKLLNMTAVVLGRVPIAIAILPFVPAPAVASWPYIFVGISLHVGYQLFLLYSYRVGDFTQVYPIARGSAPLLVAGISIFFLEVQLSGLEILAVLTIGAGIISISLVRQTDGLRNVKAARLAFCTGCFIAGYSLIDGMGVRLAESAFGFFGWLTLGNAIVFALIIMVTKPHILMEVPMRAKSVFIVGGSAAFIAYALVIWAFTQAPITLVTALREISIVFALLIGAFMLKERLDLAKVFSTLVVLCGVALLRFSKSE